MLGGVKLLNIDSCTDLNGKFQSQKSSMLRKYKPNYAKHILNYITYVLLTRKDCQKTCQ